MKYAGFWRRLYACILDLLLIGIPAWLAFRFALRSTEVVYATWRIGGTSLLLAMNLYLLVRFGGTPGKLISGIRVVQVDGSPLTWRNALARESVYIARAACGIIMFLAYQSHVDHELVRTLPSDELAVYWRQVYPPWSYWLDNLYGVYAFSEVVVMLTNKKRRAIHDFLGGTVVVVRQRTASV